MNDTAREAILTGVSRAAEVHDTYALRSALGNGLAAVDVFGLIEDLQIPISFESLDRLLGACVRISSTEVGILINDQRDLHMQRFTAAHELGHFVLEHEGSLDREVRLPGHTSGRDPKEVEADAFAAELLMPKWLVRAIAERHDWWTVSTLSEPAIAYQLSLRLAISFEATCWGLVSQEFLDRAVGAALAQTTLKKVKQLILEDVPLADPWADVWQLRAADHGSRLEAGPNDVFLLDVDENASAGFRWDLSAARADGFVVLKESSQFDQAVVGGTSKRRIALGAPPPGNHTLRLSQRRSFARQPSASDQELVIHISTVGTRRAAVAPVLTLH